MDKDFYISLIYKKLSKEISSEESKLLEEWIAAEEANQLLVSSVEKAWEVSGNLKPKLELDLDSEFADLEQLMEETLVKKLNPKRNNWMVVAAGIAVVAVALFLLRGYFTNTPDPVWVAVETASGETKEIKLEDQSTIWLNENSRLEYQQPFSKEIRSVKLAGEAFFDVESNPQQPFIIDAGETNVKVLGTQFNVRNYIEEAAIKVQVVEGKVAFSKEETIEEVVLEKDQGGVYSREDASLLKETSVNSNELAWHTKKLAFVQTSFSQTIQAIEAYYQIQIKVLNEDMYACDFTSTFENESLQIVLETLEGVFDLSIENINDTTFELQGGNCQ